METGQICGIENSLALKLVEVGRDLQKHEYSVKLKEC